MAGEGELRMRLKVGAGACSATATRVVVLFALAASLQAELRVAQGEAVRAAVKKPAPEYSPVARQMRVQGEVEVEVAITDKGEVDQVKVLTGNALLTPNVVKTVKDWKFTPFVEGGKPTSVVTQLKFSFKL